MPQQAWSDKRERQYEHVKESAEQRGVGEDRAQSGESKEASRTST